MPSKSRLFVFALAAAGLGAVALGYAAPQLGKAWQPNAEQRALAPTPAADARYAAADETQATNPRADNQGTRIETGRDVRVDVPHAAVRVDKDSGKVAVKAPGTDVKVDPDKGQVRVRAPYVNLDIRW